MAIDALCAAQSESDVLLCNNQKPRRARQGSPHGWHLIVSGASMPPSASKGRLREHGVARDIYKQKQRSNIPKPPAIEQVDAFDQCCAQAIAIASLLMEADSDPAIQDSAWAIRSLVERARAINESLRRR